MPVLSIPLALALIVALGACRSKDECPRCDTTAECPEAPARSDRSTTAATSAAAPAPSAGASTAPVAAPKGFVRVFVANLISNGDGAALLLAEDPSAEGGKVLPVFVAGTEAVSLSLRLRGERFPRPLTHDLLEKTLGSFGGKVVQARITRLDGTTFIGALIVARGSELLELDARPSDAIALALGSDAAIYLASEVMERAGVSMKDLTDESRTNKPKDPTFL